MGQIGFKARLIAPYFTEAPREEVEKWAKNTIAAAEKTYKLGKKAIKTRKDFDQKIAKPIEETLNTFLPDGYITKHGLTKKDVMNKTRDKLKRAGKRYILKRKEVYESPYYKEDVEFGKNNYAESWVKTHGPLKGYKKGGIKGLSSLGAMALTGDKDLKSFLKKDMDKIEGDLLCIAAPDKMGEFKNALRNLINRLGTTIIGTGFNTDTIRRANEELNQLIEKYRLPEFIAFSPAGISHIDFIVIEIPNPVKPNEMIKQLGLDIQVIRKE